MDKDLKKLYNYCKSQGYEGSPEEFQQELEELRARELNNTDLSDVSGGRKSATAFAASLISALSIASPFTSAAQTMQSDSHTVMSTLNKYKSSIANKLEKGINQVKKNEKTLKNILFKGVLPVGAPITLIGAGILIKNKMDDNSTPEFLAQLLAQSFDECADYCANVSDEEKRNIDRRITSDGVSHSGGSESTVNDYNGKITCLRDASNLCSAIIGNDDGASCSKCPSNYNELKQFVNSKNIKKSNGNFTIDDSVKSCLLCFNKISGEQRIVAPNWILSYYLKDNNELVNKITEYPCVKGSMKKLEDAINNLKRKFEEQKFEEQKPAKPSPSINTPTSSQPPVNVPDNSGVPIPPPVVQSHPSSTADSSSASSEEQIVENLTLTINKTNRKLLNGTTQHPEKSRMKMYRQEKELASLEKQRIKKSETQKDPQEFAEELLKTVAELEAQIARASTDYEEAQKAQKENESKLNAKQKERDKLVEQISRKQQKYDEKSDDKQKRLVKTRIDKLTKQLNALKCCLEDLKRQAKEVQKDVQSRSQTLEQLKQQLAEAQAQLDQLRSGSST